MKLGENIIIWGKQCEYFKENKVILIFKSDFFIISELLEFDLQLNHRWSYRTKLQFSIQFRNPKWICNLFWASWCPRSSTCTNLSVKYQKPLLDFQCQSKINRLRFIHFFLNFYWIFKFRTSFWITYYLK